MKGSDVDYLLRDSDIYGGVLASNQLRFIKKGKLYVVNTKPSTHPGLHWTIIDNSGPRRYFFDSFGHSPGYYGFKEMPYWPRGLQGDSDTCGLWCCYYAVNKDKNKTPAQMFKRFNNNKKANDRFVIKWASTFGTYSPNSVR